MQDAKTIHHKQPRSAGDVDMYRITSYNVCYTKLLRTDDFCPLRGLMTKRDIYNTREINIRTTNATRSLYEIMTTNVNYNAIPHVEITEKYDETLITMFRNQLKLQPEPHNQRDTVMMSSEKRNNFV